MMLATGVNHRCSQSCKLLNACVIARSAPAARAFFSMERRSHSLTALLLTSRPIPLLLNVPLLAPRFSLSVARNYLCFAAWSVPVNSLVVRTG